MCVGGSKEAITLFEGSIPPEKCIPAEWLSFGSESIETSDTNSIHPVSGLAASSK